MRAMSNKSQTRKSKWRFWRTEVRFWELSGLSGLFGCSTERGTTPPATACRTIGLDSTAGRHWVQLAVFAAALGLLIATMPRDVRPYDEGLILFGSARVQSGDIPYRDFYANYGPGQFYVLATLFKVFGPSVLVERLWDLLIRACTVLVVYLIVDRTWNRRRALLISLLVTMWLSYFEFYGYPVFPCLLLSLLSLYCLISIYRGYRATAPLLASGVCVGITILFRPDIGIAAGAGGAFTLGLFHIAQKLDARQRTRALLRSGTIYLTGIALASGPALVLLFAAGATHDMLVDIVFIPARIYVRMRSLPFPSLGAIAADRTHLKFASLERLAVYLPLLGVLLGVAAAWALRSDQQSATTAGQQAVRSQRLWTLFQLIIFSLLFFFKGWVRVEPLHMALSIVPSLIILGVCRLHLHSRRAEILSGIGVLCLLVTSLPPIQHALARPLHLISRTEDVTSSNGAVGFVSSTPAVRPEGSGCFPPKGLERIRCLTIPEEQAEAIHYIQQHTTENEGIFVGSNRHDKIFVNDVLFYFASKRSSVTKWHQFDPGVQTTGEIQSEIVAELQRARPRYIVLNSRWDNVNEPNESARSSGVKTLDQYIGANYQVVASFGTISVLQYQQH
jgi:Dolichyl-phosphate-mannose-protein mannosyltransferase